MQRLSKTADWVADKLNPVKGVRAARETLASALQTARAATDPDVAVQMATDSWNKFAAYPAGTLIINGILWCICNLLIVVYWREGAKLQTASTLTLLSRWILTLVERNCEHTPCAWH